MTGLEPQRPSRSSRWYERISPRWSGAIMAAWSAGWIVAFADGHSEIGLPMMLGTGAIAALLGRGRGRGRRERRDRITYWGRPDLNAPPGPPAPAVPPVAPAVPEPASPERRLASALVRAETNRGRIDDDSVALVRELDGLLRPMLAGRRDVDPGVRHDVEAIAAEHLPAVLDAYLAVPADSAREPIGAGGATPADELRAQLTLLVEGCTQLRDAIRAADVHRQQQLGRFLEAKFGRSDLDL